MAKNYIQDGEVLSWLNSTGAAIASEVPVAFGIWCMAIALVDIAISASGAVAVEGVWQLTKYGAVSGAAIAQGAGVWWDATNGYVVNAPAKNTYFLGFASEAALTAATTVNVILEEFSAEGTRVLTLAATGTETLGVGDFVGGDLVVFVPNTAAKTINLPPVANIPISRKLTVRKTSADVAAITLDPNASELIAGGATHAALDANNDWACFINTGTAWALVNSTIA